LGYKQKSPGVETPRPELKATFLSREKPGINRAKNTIYEKPHSLMFKKPGYCYIPWLLCTMRIQITYYECK